MRPLRWFLDTALSVSLAGIMCLFPAATPAQRPRPDTGPSRTAGYRVAGRVLNATSGEPVRGSVVSLLSDPDNKMVATTVSDADGRFAFDHLPAAKFPLTASKRGFRIAFYDEHEEFNSAIVTGEGQDTEHLTFRLTPDAVLYGAVTGDGGDPVEGAAVLLFKTSAQPGEHPMQTESTITDDNGGYEFSNLAGGAYLLAVKAEPWFAVHNSAHHGDSSALDVAYPVTFYDSTTDEASASPITIAPGAREEANLTLHAVPAIRINLGGAGSQGGASVEVHQSVFGIPLVTGDLENVGGPRGETEVVGVPPGHYEITHGMPPRTLEVDLSSNVDLPPEAGTPAVSISGTLRTTTGPFMGDAIVRLDPAQDSRGHTPIQGGVHNGRFHIDGASAGRWTISVFANGDNVRPASVVSITENGRTAAGDQVTVADRPLDLTVMVSRSQTSVQGFARSKGKAVAGAMVMLVPNDPGAYLSLLRRDQSDSDGSFSLRDVPAGAYTLLAIQDGWTLDWRSRQSIARFLSGGQHVEIPEHAGNVFRLDRPVEAVTP